MLYVSELIFKFKLFFSFLFFETDVESTFEISPIVIGAVLTVFISCSCIVCRICIFAILKKIRKTEETEVKLNQQTQNHISYADVSFLCNAPLNYYLQTPH